MILDGKPASGSVGEATIMAAFSKHCRELYWHEAFRALGKETLLVIDPEIQAAFEADYGTFHCHTEAPLTQGNLPKGVDRVLYLCRDQEWPRVKAARRRWGALTVQSMTYEIAPMGVLEEREFPRESTGAAADLSDLIPAKNILLAAAGSDSEYLQVLLTKNKLQSVIPFAGRMLPSWILLSRDFQVLRFAAGTLKYAKLRGGAVQIDLYLLYLLVAHTALKWKRFFTWLNAGDAHVLYFITRDKARQVALNQMMATEGYGSLWDRAAATVQKLTGQKFDTAAALDRLANTLDLESRLEKLMQNTDEYKIISLEDLAVAPVAVLQAVGQFWGFGVPQHPQLIDWRARYMLLPDFVSQLPILRAEIMHAYGLEDNQST